MKTCGIYKITSPTDRIYIGQSVDIETRVRAYKTLKCKSQVKLYASLKKYGWLSHKFEVIHTCEPNELNGLEKYYVDLLTTFNTRHGLNLKDGGGSRSICSDETRIRIGKAKKGRKAVFSDEHRRNLSIAAKKRRYSDKAKKEMSEYRIGMKHTEVTKNKMSVIHKKRWSLIK